MAYNYLDEKQLKDALHDSEEFMQPFFDPLAELERITRGRPGRVPKGKPKVTDGTLAGIRREKPKEVIQQLPSGIVTIRDNREIEELANATLTDIILPNANSGGTPYDKACNAIKDLFDNGSSWAYVFYNRRGDLKFADYRRKYVKDVLFEKGKTSEFDTNYLIMLDWMTEGDIKAIIWGCEQGKKRAKEMGTEYTEKWNIKYLQELLDHGPSEKDDANKSEAEKKANNNNGYFKIAKFMQIGTGAKFYSYSPIIDKVLMTEQSPDPRGVMPLHGLIAEPDHANPLGDPLASLSAGKQNLSDFDMQMYQYGQGMGYSPAVKKWGQTPSHKIKIVPDAVIEMMGNRDTDDFEVININNAAIANYTNNASYIKTQIYNEQGGTNDSSISAEAGSVGYSKTSNGVAQQEQRNERSKGHLTKLYEQWQGRIWETALNLHFAYSQGEKTLELEDETMKRMKLEQEPTMDYDQEFGKIKFVVTSGTSQEEDNDKESEKLVSLLEVKTNYGMQPDDKFMQMYNQLVKNAGVADPENLMYTDEEIEQAKQQQQIIQEQNIQQLMNPQPEAPPEPPVEELAPEDPMLTEPMPEELPQQPDPAMEDREIAYQQLIERGMSDEEAEAILQRLETT